MNSPVSPTGTDGRGRPISRDVMCLDAYMRDPQVLIEITSRCNFACTYCSGPFAARPKVDMPFALYTHVIHQVPAITSKRVRLAVDGEPTCHPEFYAMVEAANEAGLTVALGTNGSLLSPAFLDLRMDLLITISTDKEEFRARHRRMDLDTYVDTVVRYVQDWRRKDTAQNIAVQIPYLLGQHRDPSYVCAKEAFIHQFICRCGLPLADLRPAYVRYRFAKSAEQCFTILPLHIVSKGLYPRDGRPNQDVRTETGFCDSAWKRLAVLADGRVGFCCIDLSGGTAFTQPEEIWRVPLADLWRNHPRLTALRRAFFERQVPLIVCQKCLAVAAGHVRQVAWGE